MILRHLRVAVLILIIGQFSIADWTLPNTPAGNIGDPGFFYLPHPSINFQVNNNDFAGSTDKLMTGSTGIYVFLDGEQTEIRQTGYEFAIIGKLLTPIVVTRFDQPPQKSYPGVYADGFEYKVGYSRIDRNIKFEASLSADLYGHYNGDEVQKRVHEIIASKDYTDLYGSKLHSSYLIGNVGLGRMLGDYFLVMFYYRNSATIRDLMYRISFKYEKGLFGIGLQYERARQLESPLYGVENIQEYRTSWGISWKFSWYQMTFSYVSNYLKYDAFGQYYLSPLIVSYTF